MQTLLDPFCLPKESCSALLCMWSFFTHNLGLDGQMMAPLRMALPHARHVGARNTFDVVTSRAAFTCDCQGRQEHALSFDIT